MWSPAPASSSLAADVDRIAVSASIRSDSGASVEPGCTPKAEIEALRDPAEGAIALNEQEEAEKAEKNQDEVDSKKQDEAVEAAESKNETPAPVKDDEAAEKEAPTAESSASEAPKDEAPKAGAGSDKQQETSTKVDNSGTYVTPLVRKIAAENNIDLSTITGTGVGGRIRKQDVLDAAKKAQEPKQEAAPAASAAAPAASSTPAASTTTPQPSAEAQAKRGTTEKMSRLRKVIAQLKFRPSHTARSLGAGTSKLIGVYIPFLRGTYYTPSGPQASGYGHYDHVHITVTPRR